MVDFFFVLSGFVIAYNYQNQIKTLRDCVIFQSKRFLRLYPLHFIMLMVFLLLECSKYFIQVHFGIFSNTPAFSANDSSSFILNLLLLQNIFLDTLTWNGPSWSISSEFYTYILFAVLTLLFYEKKFLFFGSIFSIILLSFILLFSSDMTSSNGLLRCFYSFFLGVVVYHIYLNFKFTSPSYVTYISFFLTIFCISIAEGENIIGVNIFVPILISLSIFLLLKAPETIFIKTILNNRFLIHLGRISYGIYMIHIFVWWALIQVLRFIFKFPTSIDGRGMTEVIISGQLMSSMIVIIGMAIIILLSHFSYKKIEKPVNNLRKKII